MLARMPDPSRIATGRTRRAGSVDRPVPAAKRQHAAGLQTLRDFSSKPSQVMPNAKALPNARQRLDRAQLAGAFELLGAAVPYELEPSTLTDCGGPT